MTPRLEHIPDNVLLVDLIHRAVKRLFEGDGTNGPIAPSVRVINLSIGDPNRPFLQSISPLARLLDWLSQTYNVLFIISAGNHSNAIQLDISQNVFESYNQEKKEATVVKALFADCVNRRILSPAESINGLTVGSVQYDSSQFNPINKHSGFNPFLHSLPSPISAFGSGYRRSIKPDIVFPGGMVLYKEVLKSLSSDNYAIEPLGIPIRRQPPGNKTAIPPQQAISTKAVGYSCGTSNATALISHAAGICYEYLQQIFAEQTVDVSLRACEVPLLKAMLVHSCSWGDMGSRISEILYTSKNKRKLSGLISRWIGYGTPELGRVLNCTEQRATVLGFGQLSDGEANVFNLPLPPSLGSRREWRRLTATMAWLSPISAGTQRYRTANLWFEILGVPVVPNRKESCSGNDGWHTVRRGTVQHEVFEGKRAEPLIDGEVLRIKVNCSKDAGRIQNPVTYGLVVSLEVAEGVNIPVYNEIKTRITTTIQIQPTTNQKKGN